MDTLKLAKKIAVHLVDKQALDIQILDLRELTTIADYFIIATGSVDVHVKALVDHVQRSLINAEDGQKPIHIEGYDHLYWVLIDYGDVIVHLFQPEAREFYKLEKLWGDAPVEHINSEVRVVS